MDQYELVRTGYRVYGKNISELARMTGHSRNTIKKAIRGEPWGYKERNHQPFPALGDYLATIDGWLENDKSQPTKQRHTAHRIYNLLVDEHGYSGSESTVRRYVRFAKMKLGMDRPHAFVRFGNCADRDRPPPPPENPRRPRCRRRLSAGPKPRSGPPASCSPPTAGRHSCWPERLRTQPFR